jgi:hypothetical protein
MGYPTKAEAFESIRKNIDAYGYHIYLIAGGALPRFIYTVGLSDALGAELVLAGGAFYERDEAKHIVGELTRRLQQGASFDASFDIDALGRFSLRQASQSWIEVLLLGAVDFYRPRVVSAYQIVPDESHRTIDIPELTEAWSATSAPIWKWLEQPWSLEVSRKSIAVTNLAALRGERITEAARWEEDQWELFAGSGPDTLREEMRVVPLGTLLAADPSLDQVVELGVGEGLFRAAEDEASAWQRWESVEKGEP